MKRYVTLTVKEHQFEVRNVINLILAGHSIRETAFLMNLSISRINKDVHEYIKPYFGEEAYLKVKKELDDHRMNRPRMLPKLEEIENEKRRTEEDS